MPRPRQVKQQSVTSKRKPGAPPGTLVPRADAAPSRVVVRRFGPDALEEKVCADLATLDVKALTADPNLTCVWVEVTGLGDAQAIAAIGRAFGLHDLALEDALDLGARAKVDYYDDYTFLVLKTLRMEERVEPHQLSVFFGQRVVITFEDTASPDLEPVRERLRHARGKIRTRGPDYLAYALIDAVIDHYFPVMEAFDDSLELAEDAVLEAKDDDPIDLARRARQDLQTIRHAVRPARDSLTSLLREEVPWLEDDTRVHLKDCYDHLAQLHDMVESSREIAASLLEAYISRVSLRTNEVMKVLTVVATIFIPLSFITGLYGMNFRTERSPFNMPELNWYWGYPFSLLLMLGVAVWSLAFVRSKG